MVSVIVPVYNAKAYLSDCLESLARQSFQDFEVLIVDDGSEDGSLAISQEWVSKDGRFHVFSQQHVGVSVARNRALQEAKGEYISFVDADDVVAPDYLAHLLELSKDGSFPVCEFTRNIYSLGRGKGEIKYIDNESFIVGIVEESIKHASIWLMLFKRSIIERQVVRFVPGCARSEDTEFCLHYLLFERDVVVSTYRAYYYRQNPFSVTGTPATKETLTSIEAAGRINKMLYERGILHDEDIVLSSRVLVCAFMLAKDRNKALYMSLHDQYDVKSAMKKMLSFPRLVKRLVASLYLILGENLFFLIVGAVCGRRY